METLEKPIFRAHASNSQESSLLHTFMGFAIIFALASFLIVGLAAEAGSGPLTSFVEALESALTWTTPTV